MSRERGLRRTVPILEGGATRLSVGSEKIPQIAR